MNIPECYFGTQAGNQNKILGGELKHGPDKAEKSKVETGTEYLLGPRI